MAGGKAPAGDLQSGFFVEPTVFAGVDNRMRIAREEIFGPVVCAIPFDDLPDAIAKGNDTPFGLSAGICTSSLKYAKHFQANAQAGLVMVNVATAGLDYHAPFGGAKASGYGPRRSVRSGLCGVLRRRVRAVLVVRVVRIVRDVVDVGTAYASGLSHGLPRASFSGAYWSICVISYG